MEIKEYIESGVLESYVLGSASEKEINELLMLKSKYPQIHDALAELEEDLERIAQHMAVSPPPGSWNKIENELNEITRRQNFSGLKITKAPKTNSNSTKEKSGHFIEVQGPSSHMRVHKLWRWILGAIFVLGKIFLGFAIYYYLESRQAQQEIQDLKQEMKKIQQK
ncbi:MAG: hypothetical protein P0Y49_06910 [Candidatus Pedobacter colombiensis]|uniref:Anti-sigma factor n=1 Tax=Candidatus Pedobacter colombiensis TaxID=3121371 RepID=A0AAJ6B813_9SPHI|nr:hypothetical protein [Pedobacter sp.]WEK20865.1 MAG: hypothetical protein P0Y49_06910 [Pedobacter sp.]